MTDLTERLREWGRNDAAWGYPERSQDMLSAATTLETLMQENARLREALEEITRLNLVTEWTATRENPESHWETRYGKFATIARKALGGGDE